MLGEERSERAILILDMVNDVAHQQGRNFERATQDIIPFVQGELQYFRERTRQAIFCNTVDKRHSADADASINPSSVIQALSPRTGEICVSKTRPNAFFGTELLHILTTLKAKNLTIVGAYSHTSVLATAMSALDHGFSVVVPETCICAPDMNDHIAALRIFNRWLSS